MAQTTTPPATRGQAGWPTLFGLAALAFAFVILMEQGVFRLAEAQVTAVVVHWFTAGIARGAGDIVYFGIGTTNVEGIVITPLCSSAVLVVPLLALAGVLLLLRLPALRILTGLLLALLLAVACNLTRYAASAAALQSWGRGGFNLVHEYLGSLFVIFGFAAAILLLLRLTLSQRHTSTRRR